MAPRYTGNPSGRARQPEQWTRAHSGPPPGHLGPSRRSRVGVRFRKAKAKRPLEGLTWQQLHAEREKWQGAQQAQIELEVAARQLDATQSIKASSKRLEIATWTLVVSS